MGQYTAIKMRFRILIWDCFFKNAGYTDALVKIAVLAHTARSTRAILPKQESHLAGWLN